jgi:hypothetical protein
LDQTQTKEFLVEECRYLLDEAKATVELLMPLNMGSLYWDGLAPLYEAYFPECLAVLEDRMDSDLLPLFLQQKGGDPLSTSVEEYVRARTAAGNLMAANLLQERLCFSLNQKLESEQKAVIAAHFAPERSKRIKE